MYSVTELGLSPFLKTFNTHFAVIIADAARIFRDPTVEQEAALSKRS